MWFNIKDKWIELKIFLKPNARRTALIAVHENELVISVNAKPIDGEANKLLISYLSNLLKLCKKEVLLLRGDTNRHKKVSVPLTDTTHNFITNTLDFIYKDKRKN